MTNNGKCAALFAGGVIFGSVGIKLLTSKDAKKAYTHMAAAGLRVKDSVMENVADILAGAKDINAGREAAESAVIEDGAE